MVLDGGDLSCGMTSFHEGIRPMLIGCTSLPKISRRSASPEADTRSYWPPPPLRMSATISSDEPAYLALTLQPVCCSNGLVQSGCAYPSHATRLSWPSPGPMLVGRLGLVVPPPEVLVEEPPPQPLATSASTAPSTRSSTARVKRPRCLVLLPCQPHATTAGLECLLGAVEVLPHHHQLAGGFEVDHIAGHRAEVDDLADHAALDVRTGLGLLGVVQDADLLRADGDVPAVPLDQVGDADEPGDEVAGGSLVDLDRRADLLDAPIPQDRDPVAHGERLLLVVGDVEEGDAHLLLDALQLELHLLAEFQVERAERLVEQQHLGLVDDRARQGDPLPLAAGELRRLAVAKATEPHRGQDLRDPLMPLRPRHPLDAQPVLDVVGHRHVREQGIRVGARLRLGRVCLERSSGDPRADQRRAVRSETSPAMAWKVSSKYSRRPM